MDVIHSVFEQLQSEIHQKLGVLEKQVVFILSANQGPHRAAPNEDFLAIRRIMDSLVVKLDSFEARIQTLEHNKSSVLPSPIPPTTSAGLEGLLMKPIALPSPALSARSENQIVVPRFQRQLVIPEQEDEVEPDEEVMKGVVAEEVGGIDDEEEQEEEDEEEAAEEEAAEEEEQEEEEEVEGETIELEEFIWKGKTYFKTPDHMLYRANDEGDVEDEPFAKYDPKTNTVKRI